MMIMTDVYWLLGTHEYDSYDSFVDDVTEYNQQIAPEENGWDPDKVVCQGPLKITYEALWKDEDPLLEISITNNTAPVTMGELLFVLHNESVDFLFDADSVFFEGFDDEDPHLFVLQTGS